MKDPIAQPVNKQIPFWKNRLEAAKSRGKVEDSVFAGGNWDYINKSHKEIWERYIKTNHSVLDAGCGFGRIKPLINCFRYVGVDGSPDFIEEAKERFGGEFVVGDITDLQFDNREFDWVLCIGVRAGVFTDGVIWKYWSRAEKELVRVAKKGVLCMECSRPNIHYLVGLE